MAGATATVAGDFLPRIATSTVPILLAYPWPMLTRHHCRQRGMIPARQEPELCTLPTGRHFSALWSVMMGQDAKASGRAN
jgi:hypothetical protein